MFDIKNIKYFFKFFFYLLRFNDVSEVFNTFCMFEKKIKIKLHICKFILIFNEVRENNSRVKKIYTLHTI